MAKVFPFNNYITFEDLFGLVEEKLNLELIREKYKNDYIYNENLDDEVMVYRRNNLGGILSPRTIPDKYVLNKILPINSIIQNLADQEGNNINLEDENPHDWFQLLYLYVQDGKFFELYININSRSEKYHHIIFRKYDYVYSKSVYINKEWDIYKLEMMEYYNRGMNNYPNKIKWTLDLLMAIFNCEQCD